MLSEYFAAEAAFQLSSFVWPNEPREQIPKVRIFIFAWNFTRREALLMIRAAEFLNSWKILEFFNAKIALKFQIKKS